MKIAAKTKRTALTASIVMLAAGAAHRSGAAVARRQDVNPPNCPTVYSFQGDPDGSRPESNLLDFKGTLYGTTALGGGYSCGYAGSLSCGTVFKILP